MGAVGAVAITFIGRSCTSWDAIGYNLSTMFTLPFWLYNTLAVVGFVFGGFVLPHL